MPHRQRCHAIDCRVDIPPTMFMCQRHWFFLPVLLRTAIVTCYRDGQCDDWRPSEAYCRNAKKAVMAIADKEGRQMTGDEDELLLYDALAPSA